VSVKKHATLELQNMCNTPIEVSLYLLAAAGISSRLVQTIDTKISKPMIGENRQLVTNEPVKFEK
jgi:hypothetical protein